MIGMSYVMEKIDIYISQIRAKENMNENILDNIINKYVYVFG